MASDPERDIGVGGCVPAAAASPEWALLAELGGEDPYTVPVPLSVLGPSPEVSRSAGEMRCVRCVQDHDRQVIPRRC